METISTIVWVLSVLFGILGIYGLAKKTGGKESRRAYLMFGGIFLIAGILGVLLQAGILAKVFPGATPIGGMLGVTVGGVPLSVSTGGNVAPQTGASGQSYQPTATYSTLDHWSSTAVTGTSYYKAGSAKASTTAISNVDPNVNYKYWVSNSSTYYVNPISFVGSGTNTIVNDKAYENGSLTLTAYDLIGSTTINNSAASSYNASLSSGTAKIKYTVLGSATKSGLPFGGKLVFETNNTASTIVCSGEGITPSTNKYTVTFSPSYTNYKYVMYDIAEGYDISPNGLQGVTKTFECDVTTSTNSAGSSYKVTLIPANYYYVNNNGDLVLDTEKTLNGDSTRTGLGKYSLIQYWG